MKIGGILVNSEEIVENPVKGEQTNEPTGSLDATANKKAASNNNRGSRSKNRPAPKTKPAPANEQPSEVHAPIDITGYVSNPAGNIYAIQNLPEEFIATLFAWVSRSPKSFKTHLADVINDFNLSIGERSDGDESLSQKAAKFHEKWTVGYGHSSVAEHAKAAVGIESVSRLVSAELELANQFLSITEYSQRYQKPVRGQWFNPYPADSDDAKVYEERMGLLFDAFESLIELVYTELKREYVESEEYQEIILAKVPLDPEKEPDATKLKELDKQIQRKLAAFEKLAFEDARYVLPLSMHTQLGVSANARSWADVIRKMDASALPESQQAASQLREEITKVLPTLLRHSTASKYQKVSADVRDSVFSEYAKTPIKSHIGASPYRLPSMNEELIINEILSMELMSYTGMTREQARDIIKGWTPTHKQETILALLSGMTAHDTPPESFKHVNVEISVEVSEANWHQLLRHNRMTDFSYGLATPEIGTKIPPRIIQAGDKALEIFHNAVYQSATLYAKIKEDLGVQQAQYAVLNAHYRPVTMTFSIWEAYHLINLRTSEEAQWDIRETFEHIAERLTTHYPTLLKEAKRR